MDIRNLQRKENPSRDLIESAAQKSLKFSGCEGREVSFVLVSDRKMAEINYRYTGRRGSTDVLAFSLEEGKYLGEIIISLEACRRQAEEGDKTFEEELALLVVHGVLHLVGHDHTRGSDEEKRMRELEKILVRKMKGYW